MAAYTSLQSAALKRKNEEIEEKNEKEEEKYPDGMIFPPPMRTKDHNPYAFIFDDSSSEFKRDGASNYNHAVLVERVITQKVNNIGYVFLNEVREMFDCDPIPEGQLVGWVRKGKELRTISLGLPDKNDPHFLETIASFDKFIFIDPDVDGVIYDLI